MDFADFVRAVHNLCCCTVWIVVVPDFTEVHGMNAVVQPALHKLIPIQLAWKCVTWDCDRPWRTLGGLLWYQTSQEFMESMLWFSSIA